MGSRVDRLDIALLDISATGVAEEVHAVWIAAYTVEARLLGVESFPPLARTAGDLIRSEERFVGASLEGRLVGATSFTCGDRLEISSLVVDPGFHRQGVGRSLLSEVIGIAGELPISVSTATLNAPALRLYQHAGFFEIGRSWVKNPPLELIHLQREASPR
jgi:ribosomal protein S18 acetylase RimI-like enzyme